MRQIKKKKPWSECWGTVSEIEFLEQLPLETLKKYAKTLDLRVKWEAIDKITVRRYLDERLNGH